MKKGKRVVLEVVCFLFLLCAGSLCASAAELPDFIFETLYDRVSMENWARHGL